MEMRLDILLKLSRFPEAEAQARILLHQNPNNTQYHRWFCQSRGFDLEQAQATQHESSAALLELYDALKVDHPRCPTIDRISLDISQGPDFQRRLHAYASSYLRKGIPSLFSSLKPLYRSVDKITLIENLFLHYLSCLTQNKSLTMPGEDASDSHEACFLPRFHRFLLSMLLIFFLNRLTSLLSRHLLYCSLLSTLTRSAMQTVLCRTLPMLSRTPQHCLRRISPRPAS